MHYMLAEILNVVQVGSPQPKAKLLLYVVTSKQKLANKNPLAVVRKVAPPIYSGSVRAIYSASGGDTYRHRYIAPPEAVCSGGSGHTVTVLG